MGEDQGEGDWMTPKATTLPAWWNRRGEQAKAGCAINFIPLILAFSHPGEGTLV
jgi:hypothetical protein